MVVLGGLALVVEGFIVVLGACVLVEGLVVVLGPVVLGTLTPVDGPPLDRPVVLGACLPPVLVDGREVVLGARTVDGLTFGLDP
jgi:hypothetical protein